MLRAALTAALCLGTAGTAEARWRPGHGRRSAPIIAGQPSIRVTPSGYVVAPRDARPRRAINGRGRTTRQRLGPG